MRVGLHSGQVLDAKGQGHQGQKTRLALRSPTRLAYEWYVLAASGCCCGTGGRAHFLAGEGWHRWRRAPTVVRRFGITHNARWAFGTGGGGVD